MCLPCPVFVPVPLPTLSYKLVDDVAAVTFSVLFSVSVARVVARGSVDEPAITCS